MGKVLGVIVGKLVNKAVGLTVGIIEERGRGLKVDKKVGDAVDPDVGK